MISLQMLSFQSIKNLAQTPSDLLAIPCDNIKAVMNATEKRVIKSNWSTLTEIWNIVPFLSGSFCQEIPYDAVGRFFPINLSPS